MAARIFASILAVWFGYVTIQPVYADPCPHHQPALAALARALGPAASRSESMHDSMADGGEHAHHGHHGSDAAHDCHCLGACCGTSPVSLAPQQTQWIPAIVASRISAVTLARTDAEFQPGPPHALPFATAPPSATLA